MACLRVTNTKSLMLMKTTSILTAALFLACAVSAFPQEKHPDSAAVPPAPRDEALLQTIDLNADGITIAQLVEFIQKRVEKPLNFVIKEPAQEVVLPAMRLRNVSIQTFLKALDTLVPVRVSTIPAEGVGAPVIVIESVRQEGESGQSKRVAPVPVTRAYSVAATLKTVEFDSLLDVIHELWNRSAPDWMKESGGNAISFHEPTGTLIVTAPQARQEELRSLLEEFKSRAAANMAAKAPERTDAE